MSPQPGLQTFLASQRVSQLLGANCLQERYSRSVEEVRSHLTPRSRSIQSSSGAQVASSRNSGLQHITANITVDQSHLVRWGMTVCGPSPTISLALLHTQSALLQAV